MIKIITPLFIGLLLMTYSSKANQKISKKGIEFLKRVEGEELTVYNDEAGYPTIGVGHKLKPGEKFTFITQSKSDELLMRDLRESENAINRYVNVPLTQNQYDSLVSFIFNVGVDAFKKSTMLTKINNDDFNGAVNEFDRWKFITVNGEKIVSNGLLNRRIEERQFFVA